MERRSYDEWMEELGPGWHTLVGQNTVYLAREDQPPMRLDRYPDGSYTLEKIEFGPPPSIPEPSSSKLTRFLSAISPKGWRWWK